MDGSNSKVLKRMEDMLRDRDRAKGRTTMFTLKGIINKPSRVIISRTDGITISRHELTVKLFDLEMDSNELMVE